LKWIHPFRIWRSGGTRGIAAANSSALFLTAAAQNLLCLKLAEEIGVNIGNPWITWFKAASVPALLGLLVTPYLIYKVFPPDDRINMTG